MKKNLLIAALVLCANCLFAQAGSLTVVNHNSQCGVYFTMAAVAATEGDPSPCDIIGTTYYLCPSGGACSSITWANPAAFHVAPTFSYETTFISIWGMTITTDFTWTDVSFQWQCPDPCSGAGGDMAETALGPMCTTGGSTWSGTLCTSGTSTWSSSLPGTPMSNVTIDFN